MMPSILFVSDSVPTFRGDLTFPIYQGSCFIHVLENCCSFILIGLLMNAILLHFRMGSKFVSWLR
jgi:hypothetical protein